MVDEHHTSRLTLRRFMPQDADAVTAALQNPEIVRMIPRLPWPYTHADAVFFIEQVAAKQPTTFAVCHEGALIGAVSLDVQLGYWLVPAAWGKGFATEASRALLSLHFEKSEEDIPSGHRPDNARSRNVLVKLGFKDTEKREVFSNLEQTDVILQDMVLTADEWQART